MSIQSCLVYIHRPVIAKPVGASSMPHNLLTIPAELQLLILDFALEDDFNLPTSVYDEAPERHYAFEPIPTLGTISRNLSQVHASWSHHIQQRIKAQLHTAATAYGPGWEKTTVPDFSCGQVCPCGKGKMMTSRVVLNEYFECVECNVKRRMIMELQQLVGELEGTLKPRMWNRVEQRNERYRWYCEECTKKGAHKSIISKRYDRRRGRRM